MLTQILVSTIDNRYQHSNPNGVNPNDMLLAIDMKIDNEHQHLNKMQCQRLYNDTVLIFDLSH